MALETFKTNNLRLMMLSNVEKVAEESAYEVETQKALIPNGVSHIVLKKHTVKVDKSKNEVIGVADCFMDMAGAVVQSRSRGFPA